MIETPAVAFHDLTEQQFPFTLRMFNTQTDETLYQVEVTGPGGVKIPGFAGTKHEGFVGVTITFADGQSITEVP